MRHFKYTSITNYTVKAIIYYNMLKTNKLFFQSIRVWRG